MNFKKTATRFFWSQNESESTTQISDFQRSKLLLGPSTKWIEIDSITTMKLKKRDVLQFTFSNRSIVIEVHNCFTTLPLTWTLLFDWDQELQISLSIKELKDWMIRLQGFHVPIEWKEYEALWYSCTFFPNEILLYRDTDIEKIKSKFKYLVWSFLWIV